MSGRKAFTLIELLVVVAIIALLVSMLLPTLNRAKEIARKTVCSSTLGEQGKGVAIYVSQHGSYPHFTPWPYDTGPGPPNGPHVGVMALLAPYNGIITGQNWIYGWPKLYGILDASGIKGYPTNWGGYYYSTPIERIWKGCFCPSMNAPAMLAAANNAGKFGYGGNYLFWTWFHQWAVGYQWSVNLRAKFPGDSGYVGGPCPGRFPPKLTSYGAANPPWDMWQWNAGRIYLVGKPDPYFAQAVNPDEIQGTMECIEATETWDMESTPGFNYLTTISAMGQMTPGWFIGLPQSGCRVLFNGYRHKGSPNILYADSHVASDANRDIDPVNDGFTGANYAGMKATTYNYFDSTLWGNVDRLAPRREFDSGAP